MSLALRVLAVAGLTVAASDVRAQMLVPPWGPKLEALMQEFQSCDLAANETSPAACNVFLARALEKVYGVRAFAAPDRPGGYLSANDIADDVVASPNWERIGTAEEDKALRQATADANNGVAVVAVMRGKPDEHGHVALILPGDASATSWGKNVPNSASFFLKKSIDEAYIGLPLSKAFLKSDRGRVELYRRREE